jgi:hypothetical protein
MDRKTLSAIVGLLVVAVLPDALPAENEPYLAIRTGLKCSACHVNRTGGGMRNDFGAVYGGTSLPLNTGGFQFQNRALNDWLRVGSDFRLTGTYTIPEATPRTALDINRGNVYVEAKLLDEKLTLYFDQTLAPNSTSREFFALLDWLPVSGYAKVGKFFLPSGLRLLDDQEFIRSQTGFTMLAPDQGVEVGFEPGPFSIVASVTNGSSGAAENDDGKQVTGSAAWVSRRVRLGASASHKSQSGQSNIDVFGGFGGLSVGPFSFMGEVDFIRGASSEGADVDQLAVFGEGDVLLTQGVNAKVTYGFHDRNVDRADDERTRARIGLEVFPIPYFQLSGFYLFRDDIPETEPLSLPQDDQIVVELHLFF